MAQTATALPSVIVVDIWQWTPFIILVALAGLQSIPIELYEAGEVDGAGAWQALWYITLPMLVPVMVVVVYLVWGPRGWLRRDVILPILIIPVAWLIWVLTRGAIVGAYPYGFLDASTHGWPAVLTTVAMILAFGVALALGFWGLDIAIRGQQRRRLAR